jgi:glycosyltransferase involved in cell wall biosynthesis
VPLVHPRATVVTIHDLGYRFFPSAHGARRRLELDLTTRFSCRAARRIIAPSQATRRDLEREYGIAGERIRVIAHGVDEEMRPVRDPARLAEVRARYGIRSDYLLYLGTLQPRKNVGRLVDAFLRCRQRAGRDLTLVLAGQPGWLLQAVDAHVAGAEARGAVVRPGYVAREDLPALYSGALAFVFPSLYEGFGLPVLEAMACGAPVLASSTSSLPEVVGDAGMLVSPLDTGALAAALERLVADADLRSDLAERGLARARQFTWERCGRRTLDVIREAAVL